jgi:glycosyltransferase involved in cell wall biosynthesis
MNVLFLEGDMSRRGGTERMTAWLSSMLSRNHTVLILSLRQEHGEPFFPLAKEVSHGVLRRRKTLGQIKEIKQFIRAHAIEVVINVDTGMGYIGILASRGTGAKVITWEHSNFFNNWDSRIFPYLRRFAAKKSDALVVLTHRDRHNYQSNVKSCTQVFTIPNPAKNAEVLYDLQSKTILSIGLLAKIKRFDLIVPTGKLVFARHPDWRWVLCGDGPEKENLENAVREAGLEKHVLFRGSVKDPDKEYAGAAMYVLTSEKEGLPMVLLEAKSHGLPIVSFDIETGPGDVVRHGINGYLVASGDTVALAERICELIENSALRKDFSDHAKLDMEKFNEETILKQWETLIRGL